MRLLFLTQRMDAGDAVLGFVPRWVEGLARHCERLRVIALDAGDTGALPGHVDVRTVGRRGRLLRYVRYKLLLRQALRHEGFDTVLAHMVPRYALLAAGPARAAGARQFLWYTHGTVDARLRRAADVVESIFTASEASMRLATPKRVVTGHGIDLEHFDDRGEEPAEPLRLVSVGRVTPAKDPGTLLSALTILRARGHDAKLDLVGDALAPGDAAFVAELRRRIEREGLAEHVELHGEVPYRDVPRLVRRATLALSASRTGSVDKVVLEAMACRRPVVTCNEAFPPLLNELGETARALAFEAGRAESLADRVESLLTAGAGERRALGERLRGIVARDHEVDDLMARLARGMGGGA